MAITDKISFVICYNELNPKSRLVDNFAKSIIYFTLVNVCVLSDTVIK